MCRIMTGVMTTNVEASEVGALEEAIVAALEGVSEVANSEEILEAEIEEASEEDSVEEAVIEEDLEDAAEGHSEVDSMAGEEMISIERKTLNELINKKVFESIV